MIAKGNTHKFGAYFNISHKQARYLLDTRAAPFTWVRPDDGGNRYKLYEVPLATLAEWSKHYEVTEEWEAFDARYEEAKTLVKRSTRRSRHRRIALLPQLAAKEAAILTLSADVTRLQGQLQATLQDMERRLTEAHQQSARDLTEQAEQYEKRILDQANTHLAAVAEVTRRSNEAMAALARRHEEEIAELQRSVWGRVKGWFW